MSIVLNIVVSGAQVETEYPIHISIRSKRDKIVWRQKVQENDTQVAYLESPIIVSDEAIEVVDYLSMYSEAIDERIYATKDNIIVHSSPNLIFTTVTTDESNGFIPLFYCHKLPEAVDLVNFEPWNKSKDPNISIYNKEKNAIFSNLTNRLEIKSKIYSPSFVTYKLTANTNNFTAGSNITEIYRREPLYREETIFDYNDETFELDPNSSTYRKSQRADKLWVYEINKRSDETVFYKEDGSLRPGIFISPGINNKYIWPLEITGSRYTYKSKASGTNDKVTYDWTSDDESRWFPYYPFVSLKQEAIVINSKCFMVTNSNLILDPSSNLHVTFKVIRDDKAVIAQTTRPSLVGKVVSGTYAEKNIVKYENFSGGIDYYNGIISIENSIPILFTDKIIVEYVVDESKLQKETYNVNPLHNKKLIDGNLFYYATPADEDTRSEIHWLYLKTRWNPIQELYEPYIKDSSHQENLAAYMGKSLKWFTDTYCVFDYLTFSDLGLNTYNYLPLCLLSFKKNKYISQTKWKDLRVHAGLKEDYTLENRGKDFSLSNILNPSGTFKVRPENQVLVFIDRAGIPDNENVNYNQIVSENIGLDLIYTIRYLDFNNDLQYNCSMTEDGDIKLSIYFTREIASGEFLTDQTKILNYLKVYHCADQETYNSNDILLGTQHYTLGMENNPTYPLYELIYNIENTVLDPATLNRKLFIYLKWENEDGTINSGKSPVICIPIKDLPSTL